jgi:ribosomal protein S18 acetylase RimI-like enzyme
MQSIHDLHPQLAANRRFWCGYANADPDTDLAIYRSDVNYFLHNGVLRVRDWPLDQAIAKARNELRGADWIWWVGADSDEGTAEGLLAHGAEDVGAFPIMAVDVTTVADADEPANLKIAAVSDPDDVREYVRAYAGPLGLDVDNLELVIAGELGFAYPEVIRLAGRVDDKIVGTCTLSLGTAEVGALYCIATDPEYQRRGIATALTREALRLTGASGRRYATLQATEQGRPVYQRMGFETVSSYRFFRFPA